MIHNAIFTIITPELRKKFKAGDIVLNCALHGEEQNLLLEDKSLTVLPTEEDIKLWMSKKEQTELFKDYLPEYSTYIRTKSDLLQFCLNMAKLKIHDKLVTKPDVGWNGMDIELWDNVNHLYEKLDRKLLAKGLIVQKYIENSEDRRVALINNDVVSYIRYNPTSFIQNYDRGGSDAQIFDHELTEEEKDFIIMIKDICNFPYIFIDMLVTSEKIYLLEISLHSYYRGTTVTDETAAENIEIALLNHYLTEEEINCHERITYPASTLLVNKTIEVKTHILADGVDIKVRKFKDDDEIL